MSRLRVRVPSGLRGAPGRVDLLAVALLAFVLRLAYLLASSGGLGGDYGYDAGVYYTAAASLLHGQVPYGQFTLLHPPGLMLALAPFTVVGAVTSDHVGFEVATVAFIALAAGNAALVAAIARRCGLPREAALLGGAFYAVWFGAVDAEISARLEPLGSVAFLGGLWLLLRLPPGSGAARWRVGAAGAALGAAVCVKIWWVVPVLVVLAWAAWNPARRDRVISLAAGALAALVAVMGPFYLAAPTAMWRMVVADQLSRHAGGAAGLARLEALTSVHAARVTGGPAEALVVLAAALLGALAWRAWARPVGRLAVLLVGTQLAVLVAAPTYFVFYSGYLAPSAALLVAFACPPGPRTARSRARRRGPARVAVLAAAALTTAAVTAGTDIASRPFPGPQLARAIHVRCLMVDSPIVLIEMDALSRNLRDGCPNWVDVTGRTYDVDASRRGPYLDRRHNPRWQADILRYLRSGDAAVVARPSTGLSRASEHVIRRWPVAVRIGGVSVYRTAAAVVPGGPG